MKASPLAKKLAKERGISIDEVPATGAGGRVMSTDVEKATPEHEVKKDQDWTEPVSVPEDEFEEAVRKTLESPSPFNPAAPSDASPAVQRSVLKVIINHMEAAELNGNLCAERYAKEKDEAERIRALGFYQVRDHTIDLYRLVHAVVTGNKYNEHVHPKYSPELPDDKS